MIYSNIVLIGMPWSGKSTIGEELAKKISFSFIDTDKYIEKLKSKPFSQIFRDSGEEEFLKIEEECILNLNLEKHVISTGGSVIFSPKIMSHLNKNGLIMYLHCDYQTIEKRMQNEDPYERTVVGSDKMTMKEIYDLRVPIYSRYASMRFKADDIKEAVNNIFSSLKNIKTLLAIK